MSTRRLAESGTDPVPIRQIVGVLLLVGLFALMPQTFGAFAQGLVNKAAQGIKNDPNTCIMGCDRESAADRERAVRLKGVNAYPLAAACRAGAPAKPGAVRPATSVCTTARTACAKAHELSDEGRVCTTKGWAISPGTAKSVS